MAIQIEIDGIFKTVTKEELFSLAARGAISPTAPIEVNGKRGTANRVPGIVFGQPVPVVELPPIPPLRHHQDRTHLNSVMRSWMLFLTTSLSLLPQAQPHINSVEC